MPTQPPATAILGDSPRSTTPRESRHSPAETAAIGCAATPAAGIRVPQRHSLGCSHCGSQEPWGDSPWCLRCGYYPKLGMCIPLDAIKPAEIEEKLEDAPLPKWVWTLGLGILAILGISIYARLTVPADGPLTIWTLVQVGLGLVLFGVSHVQAYMQASGKSEQLGLVDLLLTPLAVWRPILAQLPESGWLVTRGGWGLTAIVCGFVVVGGLGWDELSDLVAYKAKQQQKIKPLQVIGRLAQGSAMPASGAESVEEAMQMLVEEIGVDQLQGGGIGAPPATAPGMKKQCAIVGYTRSVCGELRSVLVASMAAGQPDEFVAKVPVDKLPPTLVPRLESRLPELSTSKPCVECPLQAHWVRPELTCMMAFEPGEEEGEWKETKFLELLDQAGVEFDAEKTHPILEDTKKTLEQSLPVLQDALSGN